MFYQPYGQFWFLPALFLADVLFLGLQHLRLPPQTILALGLFIAALGSWITASGFQLVVKTFQSFPYLAAGALFSQWVIDRGEKVRTRVALALALACYAVVKVVSPFSLHSHWVNWLLTPMGTSAALLITLCLARSMAVVPLAFLGRHSLEILVTRDPHSRTAGARWLFVSVVGTKAMIPHLLGGTIGGLLVPVLLVWATSRLHFDFLFRPALPFVSERSGGPLQLRNA